MIRFLSRVAIVLLLISLGNACLAQVQQASKIIAPGVTFTQRYDPAVPLVTTAIKFHPKSGSAKLSAFVANDKIGATTREIVSSAVERSGAIAGINGDFFPWTADPLGLTLIDGRLVSEPWPDRPAFGVKADGTPMMGLVKMSLSIKFDNGLILKPNGIDRPAGAGEMIVYERSWGASTGVIPGSAQMNLKVDWKQLAKTGSAIAQILSIVSDPADTPIPDDGVVVVAKGPRVAEMLKAAEGQTKATITLVLQDEDGRSWLGVTDCVGGEPLVIKGSKFWVGDGKQGVNNSGAFTTSRHPRTAVGITRNGSILLVVVDGRQVTSRGASLKELASIMSNLGCTDAVNLDGGGSSTMVVRGLVVNSPSDGQQRAVASGMLVKSASAAAGQPPSLTLTPGAVQLTAGQSADLKVAVDGSEGLKPADATELVWGTKNGGAFVNQLGQVKALRTGSYKVGAYLRGAMTTSDLTVTAAGPGKIVLALDDATPGTPGRKLKVTVRDSLGNVIPFAKVTLSVVGGTSDVAEISCGPDGVGTATVVFDPAATTKTVTAVSGGVTMQLSL